MLCSPEQLPQLHTATDKLPCSSRFVPGATTPAGELSNGSEVASAAL